MQTCLVLLLGLLVTGRTALAGLDFTVQHKALPSDGLLLDKPFITDGASKIFLALPTTWKISGSGSGLDCIPDTADSSVRLGLYQASKLPTIDQAGGEDLLGQLTSQLPGDAKNAKVVSLDLNPLPIFGWSTLEVTLSYEFFGQTMRRSLMFLSMLPGRVVQLNVVAPAADFDKVHKQARQILSSWFEPSRDLPPDLQRRYDADAAVGG